MTLSRLLVIVPQQLGDVLICTPLIHAARARWPDARIDVLGLAGTLELLRGNPDVNELLEMTRSRTLRERWAELRRLWRRYDLAFVTRGTDRTHVYGLAAARRRSALVPAHGVDRLWKYPAATYAFDIDSVHHQVLEKLRLIQPWESLPQSVSLVPPRGEPLPEDIACALRKPMVVMQTPSLWRYKQWPAEAYREVAAALIDDGVQVVLTGSSSPGDRAIVSQVRRGLPDDGAQCMDACGRLSLGALRTLLDQAQAYCGPDTSVTHLAAAVGVPIVTVYGPTPPTSFGPWPIGHAPTQPWKTRAQLQHAGSQAHRVVILQGPDLPGQSCVPCARAGCEGHNNSASHCLDHLPARRVIDALRDLLRTAIA